MRKMLTGFDRAKCISVKSMLVMLLAFLGVTLPATSHAGKYAAIVIDGNTGKTLFAENADASRYPASLTKMMTLYLTFEAMRAGKIKKNTRITFSRNAAAEPPTKLGVKAGYRTGRLLGYRRMFVFGAGVAVGLLIAPTTGRELRARLQAMIDERRGGPVDLAERVRYELSHSPRTWHLPQPDVSVIQGRVQLRGNVPHDTAREELVRVAAAIQGVSGVDDLIEVEEASSPA